MAQKQGIPRVGSVRPSQLMFSAGVGALIDLPRLSVIVAGLDGWDQASQLLLTEDRLLTAVRAQLGPQVKELRQAPWEQETRSPFDHWAAVGVPVYPFPRWLRCTYCDLLSTVDAGLFRLALPNAYRPDLAQYEHANCAVRGRPPAAVPARFVTACAAGHLDDFPWQEFCHTDQACSGKAMLRLRDTGVGSRPTDMQVSCTTCGMKQHLAAAFGERAAATIPRCRGRHPHLQWFDPQVCAQQPRAMLLGASNQWFPVTESVLSLPVSADPLKQLVVDHWAVLSTMPNREALDPMLKFVPDLRPLAGYDADRVWEAIEARRAQAAQSAPAVDEPLDMLAPEWALFANPARAPHSQDFRLVETTVPPEFATQIGRVVLVERLREVIALWGFTRVDGPDSGVAADAKPENVAPLSLGDKPTWTPAAEVRGEGIFIQLPEELVNGWAERVAGSASLETLRESHKRWRGRHNQDPATGWPGERFLLIHSLAHRLLNELALECGYNSASIRERIYARDPGQPGGPMAGFLLYTSAPDSEGTLGGLVSLGQPALFGRLLRQALDHATLCSADPFCAEHTPGEGEDVLHNAACHACLFVPETSCQQGNRYLDRATLVETLAAAKIEYFAP